MEVKGNYYTTKILEQRIIVLIILIANNLVLNVDKIDINILNLFFIVLKSVFLFYRSTYFTVIILFIKKVSSVLGTEIFLKESIAFVKKFYHILVFIFYKRNGIKSTFIDMNKLERFASNFIDILKSISIKKVICIYIAFTIFIVRIKYFFIR